MNYKEIQEMMMEQLKLLKKLNERLEQIDPEQVRQNIEIMIRLAYCISSLSEESLGAI